MFIATWLSPTGHLIHREFSNPEAAIDQAKFAASERRPHAKAYFQDPADSNVVVSLWPRVAAPVFA